MESTRQHQIKVGVFTLIGIILFCLSIILLGGDRMFLTPVYQLKVHLPQVQGLGKGSVVSLNGVPVGNVDRILFLSGSSDIEVILNIEQSVQGRITKQALASVKTQGALGDKFIFIDPGPPGGEPLPHGALLETDRSPDFIDMIASKGAQFGEIVEVIKEVRVMFENINREGRSRQLMTNLVQATDNFNKLMAETRQVVQKVDRGQGTLGALINDPSLHNRLTGFLGEAPRNRFLKPMIRDSIQTNERKAR